MNDDLQSGNGAMGINPLDLKQFQTIPINFAAKDCNHNNYKLSRLNIVKKLQNTLQREWERTVL
jgi:hypothetical protein